MKKYLSIFAVFVLVALLGSSASAHIRLDPSQAVVGRQIYSVRVPNEKDIPTVGVKLMVPDEVDVTGVLPIAGWTHSETKVSVEATEGTEAGHGEAATERITEITWAGGQIRPGEYMLFSFSTNYTGSPKELVWKAYQTYSDGSVVPWDDSSEEHPAPKVSITEVSELESVKNSVGAVEQKQNEFKPDLNTWLAGAALVLGLAGLLAALKKS